MRSPLSTITTALELAAGRPELIDDELIDESLLPEARRMHQLIEDLLLLARSDEGAMQLRHDDVDIDDLLLAEASRLRGIGSVHTVTHIEACRTVGMGWNHTLCHGDLGAWEVITLAIEAGVPPPGLDRPELDGFILSGLEQHGPVSGFARDAFSPALMSGLGGVAYQLLRMHPDSDLPSVLLPDPGPVQ